MEMELIGKPSRPKNRSYTQIPKTGIRMDCQSRRIAEDRFSGFVGDSAKETTKSSKDLARTEGKKGFFSKQGRYQEHYPTHLLAGAMTCDACGLSISQASGKSGGYYGCPNARKYSCDNKVIVHRTLAEKIVLNEVRRMTSTPEQMCYLFEQVESEIANLHSDIPELIRRKQSELHREEKRLAN